MTKYSYKTVRFVEIDDAMTSISLQRLLDEHAADGWRFVQLIPSETHEMTYGRRSAGYTVIFERAT